MVSSGFLTDEIRETSFLTMKEDFKCKESSEMTSIPLSIRKPATSEPSWLLRTRTVMSPGLAPESMTLQIVSRMWSSCESWGQKTASTSPSDGSPVITSCPFELSPQ